MAEEGGDNEGGGDGKSKKGKPFASFDGIDDFDGCHDERHRHTTTDELDELRKMFKGNPLLGTPPPTSVYLAMKGITDEEASEIAEIINPKTTHYEGKCIAADVCSKLYLHDNKISATGAAALAEALKNNTTVTEIYLHYNNIGDEGCAALMDMLKQNKTIKRMELGANGITESVVDSIKAGIEANPTIESIGLFGNSNNMEDDLRDIADLLEPEARAKRQK